MNIRILILFVLIAAAVIVLWLGGALFLLFVPLYSQRVASHSCETFTRAAKSPFSNVKAKLVQFLGNV